MQKNVYAVSVLALTMAVVPACATKKLVRTEVGAVNAKVDTLRRHSRQRRSGRGRTRRRSPRWTPRPKRPDDRPSMHVRRRTPRSAAADARGERGHVVDGRVTAVETRARRLIYEVTLSEDEGNFTFNGATLPDAAKARLDQMVNQLKADPKGIFIEIEGHTDNVGAAAYNEHLGLERADTVKRYLYEQHQVPLHKINVISYGEDKPVAPNKTRAGRAQNRRVVVRVLS